MFYNNIDLISNLGKIINSDEIQHLLRMLNLEKTKIKIKRDESDAAIESEKDGVVLNFQRALNEKVVEGNLMLSAVHGMAEGVQNHQGFKGNLPFDLKFDFSRAKVAKVLGVPNWSSAMLPIDRWDKDAYQIVIEFKSEDSDAEISSVVVQLPR